MILNYTSEHENDPFRRESNSIVSAKSEERLALSSIETALLQSGSILDARVIVRINSRNGSSEIVAYCVPTDRPGSDRLTEQLQTISGCDSIQWVSSIPILKTGEIDELRLLELPAVDMRTISELQKDDRGYLFAFQTSMKFEERVHTADLGLIPPVCEYPTIQSFLNTNHRIEFKTRLAATPGTIAYANGGTLEHNPKDSCTLIEALEKVSKNKPNSGLIIYEENKEQPLQLSYLDLKRKALKILIGLRQVGLFPGDPVILQVPLLSEHFATLWACILGGLKPVTVAIAPGYREPNGVVMKLFHAWNHLRKPTLLTLSILSSELANLKKFLDMADLQIVEIDRFSHATSIENYDSLIHPVKPKDTAFYQLTSGSTGIPKCIQITHQGILNQVTGSRQFNGIHTNDVELNWLQVDHVVPVLTCHFRGVIMQSNQVQVRTSLVLSDPLYWLELIHRHRVTHTWSPNFAFKLVADAARDIKPRRWNLSCIKAIMNAGEQVTAPAIRSFGQTLALQGFDTKAIQPSFGMAEACTCITYQNQFNSQNHILKIDKRSLSGDLKLADPDSPESETVEFVSCGSVIPGVEIRIADLLNQPLPEGRIGRLQIRGDVITPGYLDNQTANHESFVGGGWFNSGDLGFLLDAKLYLAGREKEVIIIQGANYYCYDIEETVGQVPGVAPGLVSACSLEDSTTATESLAILFVLQDETISERELAELIRAIRRTVSMSIGINPTLLVPLPTSHFSRTTSGKIQRTAMKKSLISGEYNDLLKKVDLALSNECTLPSAFFNMKWIKKNSTESCEKFLKYDEMVDPFKTKWDKEFFLDDRRTCVLFSSLAQQWIQALQRCLKVPGLKKLIVCLKDNHAESELPVFSAWLRSITQDIPDLRCSTLWIEEGAHPTAFWNEIQGILPDPEVRLNEDGRWIRILERVDFTAAEKNNSRLVLRQKPSFIISGGLGGVGRELCKWLISNYPSARILILGRKAVEALQTEARSFLDQHSSIRYLKLDIASSLEIQAIWSQFASEWENRVDGIFHLAGELNPCAVNDVSAESVFQNALNTKVNGLKNLCKFITHSSTLIVAFSSLNAWLGGRHAGPYSASNAALEAECDRLRKEGILIYCVAWSQWRDTGMAKSPGSTELAESRGFITLSSKEGLVALQVLINRPPSTIGFGLNPQMPRIARELHSDPRPLKFIARALPPGSCSIAPSRAFDRFGVAFEIPSHEVSALNKTNEIIDMDRAALELNSTLFGIGIQEEQSLSTPTEKFIGTQWLELFDSSQMNKTSDFFELGGHSLLATQFVTRVSSQLKVDLPLSVLFSHPQLSDLAKTIDSLREKNNE